MTPALASPSSTSLLVALATSAVRTLALAGVAGLGLAAFRVRSTSVRLFTWTAVLYAALAMPLLQRMLPSLPVSAPAFLQYGHGPEQPVFDFDQSRVRPIDAGSIDVGSIDVASIPRKAVTSTSVSRTASAGFEWRAVQWSVVAAVIYLTVAFILFVRLLVGLTFGSRLRRTSQIILETRISDRVSSCARRNGLSFVPQVVKSKLISVPITMGVLSPVILLPANWRDWDDEKLDAVIAHEVSHVARRDPLTQCVSFLHRAIFWFSPLAWWLNQHLTDLMEQASDEAALAGGANVKSYATTLLGFFEALEGAPRRVWWQGVSMATAGRAERQAEARVERILSWKGNVAMNLRKSIAVMVVALAVPLVYVTASAHPASRSVDSPTQSLINADLAHDQTSTSPKVVEAGEMPTASPTYTAQSASSSNEGSSHKSSSNHTFYSYGNDDEQSFVIVSGKSDSLTMSGTGEDAEHVNQLRKKISGDFIWFRRDEKSYIIRDQGTIDRARAFWAPQEDLGKKQEALGQQQEALGKQQEELGKKMEQVQVKVPDLTQELGKLQAELKQMSSGATMEQVGNLQSEIGELQSKIGDVQSQAGEQQSKLGEQMSALGEKQGKLGEQQGDLGRQQGEVSKQASRQMKQLLNEAIKNGKAQPEQ